MEKIRIRDGKNSDPGWKKKLGSGINIPDPLHSYYSHLSPTYNLAVTMKPPTTLMNEMKAAAAASPSTVLAGW
jgi:hypothetical protein